MSLNINGVAPTRTLTKHLQASCYTQIRLALLRLGSPLRIALSELRVEMVLSPKAWLCLSLETHGPLLAWTSFERPAALHRPVTCKMHLYHVHAGLLSGIALESLDGTLRHRLARHRSCSGQVVHRHF